MISLASQNAVLGKHVHVISLVAYEIETSNQDASGTVLYTLPPVFIDFFTDNIRFCGHNVQADLTAD